MKVPAIKEFNAMGKYKVPDIIFDWIPMSFRESIKNAQLDLFDGYLIMNFELDAYMLLSIATILYDGIEKQEAQGKSLQECIKHILTGNDDYVKKKIGPNYKLKYEL